MVRCSGVKISDKICFLDDQQHPKMIRPNVDYLYLYPYKYDYEFEKMSNKFLKSKLTTLIKKRNTVSLKKTYYRLQKKTHMVTGIWRELQKIQKIIIIKKLLHI